MWPFLSRVGRSLTSFGKNYKSLDRFDVIKIKMAEDPKKLKFFSIPDLCRLFGCTRSTIYYRIHDGTLPPPIKFGRLVRWRQDELEKWFDNLYEPVA